MNNKKQSPRVTRSNGGFTLIELLIVIVVFGILTSISVASFFDYYHNQAVQSAANDVVGTLNLAKSNALSQVKNPCGTVFDGYKVEIFDSNTYNIYVVCSGADLIIGSKDLPDPTNINFTSPTPSSFLFAVLTGRVTIAGSPIITIEGFGKTRNIEVSSTGVIR